MEAKSKSEKMHIWQKAMDFGEGINKLSEIFPKKEIHSLSPQVCRASDSTALNISEAIPQSNPEQKRLWGTASAL